MIFPMSGASWYRIHSFPHYTTPSIVDTITPLTCVCIIFRDAAQRKYTHTGTFIPCCSASSQCNALYKIHHHQKGTKERISSFSSIFFLLLFIHILYTTQPCLLFVSHSFFLSFGGLDIQ